ncbi:hypothetical protein HanXRQr2_Chr17g0808341 [Helianthus annuus]|uniref:Uncharacterized protein n=1 Tax=Helianthus annuus TaxID=4232 RepID=A0A9K3DI92_HELAN|nr:hypothetical protein HanXRQr2_Chr17g0808341 [Helianthus annuus]
MFETPVIGVNRAPGTVQVTPFCVSSVSGCAIFEKSLINRL